MRRWVAGIVLAAGLASCSAGEDVKAADAAVADFHRKLNAQAYDAIWAGTGPEMKAASQPAAFVALLSAVHRKLGPYASGTQSGWNVNYGTAGRIVTVGHAAKFERGEASERFIFRLDGSRATLLGYNIDSTALIVN